MGLQKVLGLVFLFFFLHIAILPAQRFRVSGVVTDAVTKEVLAGVPVTVKELQKTGTSTNDSGTYSLSLYKGDYTLTIKFIGYKEVEIPLKVNKNISQDIALELTSVGLKEVVVSSGRTDANVAAPQVGVERVTMQEANKLPVIFGERDIIKVLQLMPGVKAASEGSAGLFVRGGTSDQNLVTLDNVPVYNASHLMGFFSTFNPNAVKDVTLYKGAMPAQYGERLSSVLDVQMRDGDIDKYHLEGGIGLIASNLSIDGPIQKGKSSFIISGRRTYADAIARLSGNSDVQNATLYFYDVNAKMNFILGSKDRLTFSGYSGRDKMAIKEAVNTDWGNLMGTLKWTHQMNSQWASSTAVQYNKYNYNINLDMGLGLHSSSKIDDYSLKEEFLYQRNPSNLWRFGYSTTYHTLTPGNYRYEEGTVLTLGVSNSPIAEFVSWSDADTSPTKSLAATIRPSKEHLSIVPQYSFMIANVSRSSPLRVMICPFLSNPNDRQIR